jgi:predicted site-specific integrase-resolvase
MYSPQKAAGIAGVSRKTVMDAINAGKLKAKRNNKDYWVVSKVDLKDDIKAQDVSFSGIPMAIQNSFLTVQLKADADTIIRLRETITDLREQRDDWKEQAQYLLKYMDYNKLKPKPPPLMLTSDDLSDL